MKRETMTYHHSNLRETIQNVSRELERAYFLDGKSCSELAALLQNAIQNSNNGITYPNEKPNVDLAQRIANMGWWNLHIKNEELSWTDELYRIFEFDPNKDEPSYDKFLELVHPDDKKIVKQAYENSLKNKTNYDITYRLLFEDDCIKYIREKCEHFYDENGNPIRSVGTVQDVTQQELYRQKEVERKIIEISEKEQQRLGRYLHDDIGQMLTGIQLISLNLSQKLEENGITESKDVAEISKFIKEIDQKVRDLSRGFATPAIEAESLQTALGQLIAKSEKIYDIECSKQADSNKTIVDKPVILHIYRITQEAIRNAVIHGKADKIKIHLREDEKFLRLSIIDNGIGFKESAKKANSDGIGIATMKYRAQKLGGYLKIDENLDGLTRVSCIFSKSGDLIF